VSRPVDTQIAGVVGLLQQHFQNGDVLQLQKWATAVLEEGNVNVGLHKQLRGEALNQDRFEHDARNILNIVNPGATIDTSDETPEKSDVGTDLPDGEE